MSLFGRELELKRLAELIDGVDHRGGALLVRGEAGIGKSALVTEARALAGTSRTRVLTTVGVPAEQHLPYAGLHQLVYPLRAGVNGLPGPQREAMGAALGLRDGEVPDGHLVGMATLNLVADAAVEEPLLLIAEDAHWLDPSTVDALAFLARRLDSEPIVLVATLRDGEPSGLDEVGLPEMTVPRLPPDTSAELLDSVAPGLSPVVRARVLHEAAGNPLALTELPDALRSPGDPPADGLPLTARLERAFGAKVAELSEATRTALLVAALHDGDAVAEVLDAAGRALDTGVGLPDLAAAEQARLIELTPAEVRFRHPLMRSAIARAAGPAERQAAHRALAETLREWPRRRVWHLAAAAAGPDEEVAGELADAAELARRRGAVATAVAALERSARLTGRPEPKAERLLGAAELAVEAGRPETVTRLLAEVASLDLPAWQRAWAAWIPTGFDDGVREHLAAPGELAGVAEAMAADGNVDLAGRILWGAGMRCFWVEPGAPARERIAGVTDRMPLPPGDPRATAISAYVAPFERGGAVLARLAELGGDPAGDPAVARFLGSAALQVGAFDLAARFAAAAQPGLRAQGRLGLLARTLAVQAWSCTRLGDLATALPAAEEAARLGEETGQTYMYGLARAVQAEIAALRGDYRQAEALAALAERVGLAAGARPVLATTRLALALVALGEGRHDDAFAELRRLHDPADPSYQLALRCYVTAELAEAALRAERTDGLAEILRELEELAPVTPSPALHAGLRYARAVLAPDDEAERLFEAALAADLTGWPLERGRVQLAFGEWLRRHRRVAQARPHLRAARETFDALGVTGWSERARAELRAAGETSPNRDPDARDQLTAHELSIARLAADGLTNREIGQRLYLSHRTVSTHLHRIFPKLGVASRGELGAVLVTYPGSVT
ncbi:LuxR family transcriptional regulator [Pseudonocardia eucalypti]|uniref:LuxR family transcriptional regulator n=1 Tax=Pseudonocardia eucalypti TaxID=648755 RepID=A0ABP9R9K1_9PSEU|nr:DNA-binding CsgD family transcriptional regulator [Pseudonocardia eucalypti]